MWVSFLFKILETALCFAQVRFACAFLLVTEYFTLGGDMAVWRREASRQQHNRNLALHKIQKFEVFDAADHIFKHGKCVVISRIYTTFTASIRAIRTEKCI
jgi:hypothetical protein